MYTRLIVKIGTQVLSGTHGEIDERVLAHIVAQMVALKKSGIEVVLVSSGAVGSGRSLVQKKNAPETVADKQVYAAIGQVKLMATYARLFEKHKHLCAQVLVTKEDFRDRGHYHNMRRCFLNLLQSGVVPIVNENDVVAIEELVFTDNDELAGLVAAQLEASAVVLLTSVEGVLDGDPADPRTKIIPEIDLKNIAAFKKYITREKTHTGRGGMMTKFAIAKKLVASGITVHIASGKRKNVLLDIVRGASVGTIFIPARKTSGIKRRLAYAEGLAMGALVVNECTGNMLVAKERVMSLLAIGILHVAGTFKKGDVVEIQNKQREKIGFGIVACDSEKARDLAGKKGGKAVVHYDYMFIE